MKKFYLMILVTALCAYNTNAQLVVFDDNYAAGVSFAAFGGSVNTLSIDATVKHSGTASIKIPVTTGYTGGALVSAAPTNLSAYNALTFWAKNDQPFLLDGVGLGNNSTTTVFAAERNGLAVTSTWTKFIIPIPVPSKLTAETGLFHFAEGSGEGMYNIWIDDIQYENIGGGVIGTPTASFATETQSKEVGSTFGANGTTSIFPVSGVNVQLQTAKAYFTWISSNLSVGTFDAFGVGTALAAGSTTVTGKLGAVDAGGVLTVNVTAAVAPVVAAPTPNRAPADVISLFSNAYTNNPVDTWSTSWSGCCHELTDLQIAGNDTKKYVLHHFAGVEFIASPVDATNYGFLHIDVWTPNVAKPFTIRLVNFGVSNTEADVTRTPAQNTWVSYDIPLSEFATLGGKNKLSQMLFLVAGETTGTFFIDNVYFFKPGPLPVKLNSFNVTRKNNTAVLQWSTATEQNNKGFSIERSSDGTNWKQINFVAGAGNSSSNRTYTVTDLIPVVGINYYRIKQVDINGYSVYSSTQLLSFDKGLLKLALFPNPAKNKVFVSLGTIESNNASYSILSSDGRVVKTGSFEKNQSNTVQKIDISSVPHGYYIFKLVDGNTQQTAKLNIN
ncbi:hypothetical protein BH10BAC3_BH10BAC3_30440 [soil metagenome]